ncbi:MAG: hypothetical protein ACYSR5_10420 [Planctomycetota bacterium]|jgi:hypothetical protein
MSRRKALKLVHFATTWWFALSSGYILVLALRQAGFHWWVIFSLSGYSLLIILLLISLYLFALFRGVARSQKTELEHPLTASVYYSVFYDLSPFLGGLSGSLAAIGVSRVTDYLLVVAYGTFWATFFVWIIVDPLAGMVEMILPSSRAQWRRRLAETRALRERQRLTRQRLLADIEAREQEEYARWDTVLSPYADRLVALACESGNFGEQREREAVDIGVTAWQIGGSNCMRRLHAMATDRYRANCCEPAAVDYISLCWDGVGSWRSPWFSKVGQSQRRE